MQGILFLMLLAYLDAFVESEAPTDETNSTSVSFLAPVRPLPCHSVTMIKNPRPTEFLFIAPGNSGDCSFIFEGLEGDRLDIKVRNLKSNLPRGNGDACEDGQVRLYNYKGSGQVKLEQRLCDNEKEVSMLTDSNMAIIASSIIDGSFSVVARSVRQVDLLAEADIDQILQPPDAKGHEWNLVSEERQDGEENQDDSEQTSESNEFQSEDTVVTNVTNAIDDDALENIKEPSELEIPPNNDSFVPNYFVLNSNETNMNSTHQNCSYNSYGYYECDYGSHSSHAGDDYNQGYYYQPKPIYKPPYQKMPVYEVPRPVYNPPIYSSPAPTYSPPVYKPPEHHYAPPNSGHKPPSYSYSVPNPVYKPSGHDYYNEDYYHSSSHEKPFRPSQPIPNDFWESYESYQTHHDSPIWYDDNAYGPYPGKPTKLVHLTHDSYPSYPSYYNPNQYGSYGTSNVSTTTSKPSLTTRDVVTKSTSKVTTKQVPSTTTQKPTTTKKHFHFFPWTANVSITSGDNLKTSFNENNETIISEISTTTPRIKLNRIIYNLPKLLPL